MPAPSTTLTSAIAILAASLSVILPIASPSEIVVRPVMSLNVTVYVSVGSTKLSSAIATVNVFVAPLAEFAGKLSVPLVVV